MSCNSIEYIRINGFKSIGNAEIDLRKLNVIIGGNGTGKSNFLSLFSLMESSALSPQKLNKYVNQTGSCSLFHKSFDKNSRIDIFIKTDEKDLDIIYFPKNETELDFKWKIIEKNGYGLKTDVSDFKKLVKSWRFYHFNDASFVRKIKSGHKFKNKEILADDAHNLASVLFWLKKEHPFHYEQIIHTIKMIVPYFRDFILDTDDKGYINLRWIQEGESCVFEPGQMSDGMIRFMCLSTLLLQPPNPQISTIIIDEPELGLHPFAISILAEIIKTASEDKQVIVSTQSKDLLDNFNVKDIIVAEKSGDSSTFRRLEEEELAIWLDDGYSLGKLWNMNIFGGNI